ncbi:unnamed protein product [Darwinula stevensoni]|uniref:Uncharacterized protein n=1 Tax=Darwinula stevensoni TaxID=69355 RepID=A0A7R9AG19_9CRUS|nr:unnamed protein product [Darwinula stevensoni]CAG0903863.1 unnamed protein product [Darwinula stevensoni]
MEEEEVWHWFSQQVTSESLKSFMGMRKPEEADEWTSFVKLRISRQAIQRGKDYPETGQEDPGDIEKCLLSLHAHQGRWKAKKKIPTSFCAGDIMHAAEVRESLRRHDLKTDVAILQGEDREGKEELPLLLKLVTLVDFKLESEKGGDDSQRSAERLPGFESETQIEAMNVGEETVENFDLEMSPDIPEDSH